METLWQEAARDMVKEYGYWKAKQKCIQWRDMNAQGTVSFAYHQATLKEIEKLFDETQTTD